MRAFDVGAERAFRQVTSLLHVAEVAKLRESRHCSRNSDGLRYETGVGSLGDIRRLAVYRRGRVWYLRYCENGRRRQPRVGQDRTTTKQLAAEINSQLEVGAPTALGFEPIAIEDLRQRWLDFHENVRRSSIRTVCRYRTATQHLIDFLSNHSGVRRTAEFRAPQATEFVRFLRRRKVSPNGHQNARTRRLLDTVVKYILETCSALFNYAQRHRHLPPYGENPFRVIEVSRIPIGQIALRHPAEQPGRWLGTKEMSPVVTATTRTDANPGRAVKRR